MQPAVFQHIQTNSVQWICLQNWRNEYTNWGKNYFFHFSLFLVYVAESRILSLVEQKTACLLWICVVSFADGKRYKMIFVSSDIYKVVKCYPQRIVHDWDLTLVSSHCDRVYTRRIFEFYFLFMNSTLHLWQEKRKKPSSFKCKSYPNTLERIFTSVIWHAQATLKDLKRNSSVAFLKKRMCRMLMFAAV